MFHTAYAYTHVASANEDDEGPTMDAGEGQCMVCGDRSAGKHYGVMACYGCKGFFRRTIRSSQSYTCRFQQKCSIDKDQRNACRYCRFQRCLNVGMEPEAIRPDRDVIGKQKNPRKKKMRREDSSLPSPGCESPSSNHEDVLLGFLAEVEIRASEGCPSTPLPIGISVKSDPDFDATTLFQSQFIRNEESFQITYAVGRTASVEQLIAALRRYILSAVHWIEQLFQLMQICEIEEKVALLKTIIGPFTVFSMAARTAQISDGDVLCLCNRSTISRQPARHLLDTNLVGNNLVGRVLDDLVFPTKKLLLSSQEIVILSALIVLDPDARGLSVSSSEKISQLRDRVQNALFTMIREATGNVQATTSRFGNLLLLFPPLAKLSSLIGENVQMARMFGIALDPLLVQLFADDVTPEVISAPLQRQRSDVSTQTSVGDDSTTSTTTTATTTTTTTAMIEDEASRQMAADILGLLPIHDAASAVAAAANCHNALPVNYNPFYFPPNIPAPSTSLYSTSAPTSATYNNPFFDASNVGQPAFRFV